MACVYCNCEVYEVWNLGFSPLSDTFCDSKKSALNMQTEKLAVGCCRSCGLTQNTILLSEEKRYKDNIMLTARPTHPMPKCIGQDL